MYIRKAEKMRLVGILVFITCFLSFYTYAEAGSGKSPVQGEFNVQAVKLKSILAVCDCFLTSYEYVPVDRFVNEEYVETTRHPNFDIIRFLRAVSFFQTAIPPFCTVWQRAAYRYEICIKAVNADSSIVLVCADVIRPVSSLGSRVCDIFEHRHVKRCLLFLLERQNTVYRR